MEILSKNEDKITISSNGRIAKKHEIELVISTIDSDKNEITVNLVTEKHQPLWQCKMTIKGEEGFEIEVLNNNATIQIGMKEYDLKEYFSDYPPLIRFIDLSELDGNILLKSDDSGVIKVSKERLIPWDWTGTVITLESIWKNGVRRNQSVQERVAKEYIKAEFELVYDDDDAGEAADLICMKEKDDHIRLVLIHCKFSGSEEPGKRIKDVVEVSSQAVRSARWVGKFKTLVNHIQNREKRHTGHERSGYLNGANSQLEHFLRLERMKFIKPEIIIVQPGVQKAKLTESQSVVLAV